MKISLLRTGGAACERYMDLRSATAITAIPFPPASGKNFPTSIKDAGGTLLLNGGYI